MATNIKSIPDGAIKIVEVIWGYDEYADYVDFDEYADHAYIDDGNVISIANLWLTLDNKYVLYADKDDIWLDPEKEELLGWLEGVSMLNKAYYLCHKNIDGIENLMNAIEKGEPSTVQQKREQERKFQKILASSTKLISATSSPYGLYNLFITPDGDYFFEEEDFLDDTFGAPHDDLLDWIDELLPNKYNPKGDKYTCYNGTDILELRAKLIASTNQIRLDAIPPNAIKLIKAFTPVSGRKVQELLWRTNDNKYLIDDGLKIIEQSLDNVLEWIEKVIDTDNHYKYMMCYKKTDIFGLKKELISLKNSDR